MKTWKFFLMAFAAMAVACGGDDSNSNGEDPKPVPPGPGPEKGELILSVSPGLIKADGVEAAVFTATLDGAAVTDSNLRIYTSSNEPLESTTFTTTKPGTYTFWAAYGVNISNKVTISATEQDVPELPADANPSATNFKHRILMTQFTGTPCPNCPYMTSAIHNMMEEAEYADNVVLSANHSYNAGDASSKAADAIAREMGISSYPTTVVDLCQTTGQNSANITANTNNLKRAVDARMGEPCKAGISAVSSLSGNFLIVRAAVKAGVQGQYNVNAWVIEDNVYGTQAGNTTLVPGYDYNNHNNCIRMSGSKRVCLGDTLGTLAAGNVGEQMFVMELDSKWKSENIQVIVYVTTLNGNSAYVTNAILLDANDSQEFEYAN